MPPVLEFSLERNCCTVSEHEMSSSSHGPSWVRVESGRHDVTIEDNWLFRLRKERFQSRQSGKIHDYFVAHLADAVHVVALTPDDHVLLVKQFRAGSGARQPGDSRRPGRRGRRPVHSGCPRAAGGDRLRRRRPRVSGNALVEPVTSHVADLDGCDPQRSARRRAQPRSSRRADRRTSARRRHSPGSSARAASTMRSWWRGCSGG